MDKRSQTLEALAEFIESQRALLARQQCDIDRLTSLRGQIDSKAAQDATQSVREAAGAISELGEFAHTSQDVVQRIDWSLFSSTDPKPMHDFDSTARLVHAQRHVTPLTQLSPPSALQLLVRTARVTMLEPLFAELGLSFDPPPPTPPAANDEELDPAEAQKQRARARIRELKQRTLHGGGSALTLQRRAPEPAGVFVRRDLEDESAEVDISMDVNEGGVVQARANSESTAGPSSSRSASVLMPPPPMPPMRSARSRTSSRKAQDAASVSGPSKGKDKRSRARSGEDEFGSDSEHEPTSACPPPKKKQKKGGAVADADAEDVPAAGLKTKSGKPRPETFKVSWSIEEQQHLERLLEEIPDGSKNRWLQISRAMGGKRTPRQVASRVQKYFEKLKRFGLDAEAG